jgi:hypothetical protein
MSVHVFNGARGSGSVGTALFMGGTIKYQPTSASAAAWRQFTLFFLETRVVAGDAVRLFVKGLQGFELMALGLIVEPAEFSLAISGGIEALNNIPFCKRQRLIDWVTDRPLRHHQIPAYSRERSGVAELHVRRLAAFSGLRHFGPALLGVTVQAAVEEALQAWLKKGKGSRSPESLLKWQQPTFFLARL